MNTISDIEWNERLAVIISKGLTHETVKEAFTLYNDKFTPQERKTFCGGCTQRVWKRLQAHYELCKTK